MKKVLVTGGTVFVSKYVANYFKEKCEVYVLNRNTREQLEGVHLIEADRHSLGDKLKNHHFDAVIDVCAYDGTDVRDLLDAVGEVKDYILISSSAVYPETNPQPFCETQRIGANSIWGDYGTGKIEAEQTLLSEKPSAYILRPPYLYGPMQNVYREPFVFECALAERPFYIPKDGTMKLQFFHVEDLCRMIEKILQVHPQNHIYNVGNEELVDINTFVALCYKVAGKELQTVHVHDHENQRDYFSFYDYEYALDISRQKALLPQTKDLEEGLQESFAWYVGHLDDIVRKGYIDFIDTKWDFSMTNKDIIRIALQQSSFDCNCNPEDFLSNENKVVISQKDEKARAYLPLPFECDLVSYGNNIIAQVSPRMKELVEWYIGKYEVAHCFESPNVIALNEKLVQFGYKVCFMAEYFLPDVNVLKEQSCSYDVKVLTPAQFGQYYTVQWQNALCEKRKHLDVLAVGAFDKDKLVGLAGCSADCETMYQIGVDVLPEYRRKGIASAITSRLAIEILKLGKVPFYCAAWSNIKSVRNAIKSGFRPAWVELTARSSEFVDEMNK